MKTLLFTLRRRIFIVWDNLYRIHIGGERRMLRLRIENVGIERKKFYILIFLIFVGLYKSIMRDLMDHSRPYMFPVTCRRHVRQRPGGGRVRERSTWPPAERFLDSGSSTAPGWRELAWNGRTLKAVRLRTNITLFAMLFLLSVSARFGRFQIYFSRTFHFWLLLYTNTRAGRGLAFRKWFAIHPLWMMDIFNLWVFTELHFPRRKSYHLKLRTANTL